MGVVQKYPLTNNVWVGYFEDVSPDMENMNQVIPLEFARYVLLHPDKDPHWREHARKLIDWVKTTPKWPKYIVHGATVTTEQGDGKELLLQPAQPVLRQPHLAPRGGRGALLREDRGCHLQRDAALSLVQLGDLLSGTFRQGAATPFGNQWWFTDEFADGPRRLMDAFWAVPEWAPADESHLLGSSSVVTHITYGKGSVTYSTFDPHSVDVLRLDFVPSSITADGKPLSARASLDAAGYSFDPATHVLHIRHDAARSIDVQGSGGQAPPFLITFDAPHLPAGTALQGQYPSGVIDWGSGEWRIHVPDGAFGTFNLSLADPAAKAAAFSFYAPRIFVGIDVYNGGTSEATVTVHSPELREISYVVKPGELRRIRTGWRDPSSIVAFDLKNAEGLEFDNLAYRFDPGER